MVVQLRGLISLITCGSLIGTAFASPSNIGIVMTPGSVQVDGTSVRGTSVLFGGSILTSEEAGTRLQFADGTHAALQQGARMQVYREHSILKNGVAMQQGIDKHAVVADGLRVSGVVKNASALIRVMDATHIEVAAQSGETDVWTPEGRLVARVEAGKVLSFALDQAPGGTPVTQVKLHGTLRPHYLLTDDQTQVTYQLQGPGLDPLVGSSVEVTGNVSATSAAGLQVVVVSHVAAVSAAAAAGAASGIAAATTGFSWAASSLIFLVAVVAGGSVIGLAAAGVLSPPSNAVTPVQP